MRCPRCAREYDGNFCPNCGLPSQPQMQQPYQQNPYMQPMQPQKKNMNGCLIAIIIAFGVLVFMIIVGGILSSIIKSNTNIRTSSTIRNTEDTTSEKIEYFELSQGEYEVGKDLPAATYDITGISGWGFIWIYENELLYDSDISVEVINLCGLDEDNEVLSSMYTTKYSNLRLSEGQYIKIQNTVVAGFTAE